MNLASRVSGLSLLSTLSILPTFGTAQDCAGMRYIPGAIGGLGPANTSYGQAVNAVGTIVVGDATTATGDLHAYRYIVATGSMQDLGTLGGVRSGAQGVSADGSIVVGGARNAAGNTRAFRWTEASGMQDLGTLGGASSAAAGVSADGAVVVGSAEDATGTYYRPFRWTAALGMQDLGTLSGYNSHHYVRGVSADGSVVVGVANGTSGTRAFRWTTSTGMQSLGALNGGSSDATAVNSDGSIVVGFSGASLSGTRAFRWSAANGMQDLGTVGGRTLAYGVSADGSVVVGNVSNSGGGYRPFRWTAATGMQDLRAIWMLNGNYTAMDISDDGTFIVGSAGGFPGGAAYIWDDPLPFGERYCATVASPAPSNSTGCPGRMVLSGSPVVGLNSFVVVAEQLPHSAFGFFLTSRDQGNTYPVNNSQGRLCLGGFIGRYVGPGQIKNSGTSGSFSLALDLTSMPQPFGNVAAQPGDTWHFQAWHRDANPTLTSNFTDAVSVTLH